MRDTDILTYVYVRSGVGALKSYDMTHSLRFNRDEWSSQADFTICLRGMSLQAGEKVFSSACFLADCDYLKFITIIKERKDD